jgi:hypothetical protein
MTEATWTTIEELNANQGSSARSGGQSAPSADAHPG